MASDGADKGGVADLQPVFEGMQREQRAWYWYDWANSAYVTTIATVLFAPYLTSVAEMDACGKVSDDTFTCETNLHVLGVSISPGSLVFYVVTLATIASALLLPIVGAAADRSAKKRSIMAGFAWAGSVAAAGMFFVTTDAANWQLGVLLLFVANICLGSSLVVYDAILCQIALPDERDRVSSRGWALGYLGGGLLLAVNLAFVTMHDTFGVGTAMAVRISMLSAAIWWAAFTIIPYRGIRDREPLAVEREPGGLVRQSFGQLAATLKDMRHYPMTMTFLVAYLFYNDGIQTVIASASVYGEKQLGFETTVLIATILLVQFVAFGGALLFGRLARTMGTHKVILVGLGIWMLVVVAGYFVPEKNVALFLALAVGIGLVMGGTQALSRSFFSQLIPRGREAEYFSLYQACERGTSWLGTLVFGLVHQWTHSYRPAIFALIIFFVVGMALLSRVDPRRGVEEAGNTVPQLI
ncbi:MAG: MFS transporter [Nocardioidaceae bacterium]